MTTYTLTIDTPRELTEGHLHDALTRAIETLANCIEGDGERECALAIAVTTAEGERVAGYDYDPTEDDAPDVAPVPTRSLDTGESLVAVRDLREGDLVDLEDDPIADPDGDDQEAEFEYFAVDTVTNGEREGVQITAVEFTNGAYVVFPADHKVIVYRPEG